MTRSIDLSLLNGEVDPLLDLLVLHDASQPEGSRTVSINPQNIIDLVGDPGLSVSRRSLGSDEILNDDPDSDQGKNIQSLHPGLVDRCVSLPPDPPENVTQFLIFNRSAARSITIKDTDDTTQLGILQPGVHYSSVICQFDGVEWLVRFIAQTIGVSTNPVGVVNGSSSVDAISIPCEPLFTNLLITRADPNAQSGTLGRIKLDPLGWEYDAPDFTSGGANMGTDFVQFGGYTGGGANKNSVVYVEPPLYSYVPSEQGALDFSMIELGLKWNYFDGPPTPRGGITRLYFALRQDNIIYIYPQTFHPNEIENTGEGAPEQFYGTAPVVGGITMDVVIDTTDIELSTEWHKIAQRNIGPEFDFDVNSHPDFSPTGSRIGFGFAFHHIRFPTALIPNAIFAFVFSEFIVDMTGQPDPSKHLQEWAVFRPTIFPLTGTTGSGTLSYDKGFATGEWVNANGPTITYTDTWMVQQGDQTKITAVSDNAPFYEIDRWGSGVPCENRGPLTCTVCPTPNATGGDIEAGLHEFQVIFDGPVIPFVPGACFTSYRVTVTRVYQNSGAAAPITSNPTQGPILGIRPIPGGFGPYSVEWLPFLGTWQALSIPGGGTVSPLNPIIDVINIEFERVDGLPDECFAPSNES